MDSTGRDSTTIANSNSDCKLACNSPSQQVHGADGSRSLFDFWRQVTFEPGLGAILELVAIWQEPQ